MASVTNIDSNGVSPQWGDTPQAQELAAHIGDGCLLALAPDYSGCAMSVVVALIKRGVSDLRLIGVPQLGVQGDLLIGARCVASVDAAAVTLGEYGQAPNFVRAVIDGRIAMHDSTCPVIHAGLQAAEKNIPFMPLRGVIGSDLVLHRDDWTVIDNPLSDGEDPILLVPQIKPDISLFHAPIADTRGNVWVGIRRELMLMAHASAKSLVSVERIVDHNLLDDPVTAAGTIPSLYIDEIRVIEKGAHPVGLFSEYEPDTTALSNYAKAARTQESFDAYLATLTEAK